MATTSGLQALIIQKNNTVFISPNTGISVGLVTGLTVQVIGLGLIDEIPTPDIGGIPDGDYFLVPNTQGYVSGFTPLPYNAGDPTQTTPPFQALTCFRLTTKFSNDVWWVLGTQAQYITAYNSGAALPTVINAANFSNLTGGFLAGCQTVCQVNASGQYFIELGLPSLVSNSRYFPYGYFNGVALPAGTATGYVSTTTLLAFLNSNWTNVGSPSTVITWTVSADGLTLTGTETAGGGTDVICAAVVAVNPSN
jgi:hypothetical protein